MNLKQKIQIAHSQLPLPSEVIEDEIMLTVRERKIVPDTLFLNPEELSTTETHLIFQKQYIAGLAIGWTFTKKMEN